MADRVHTLTLGHTTIQYQLNRSKRRRRSVQVSVDSSGEVLVAAPLRVPLRSIEDFLISRQGWLARQLEAQVLRASRLPRQYRSGESVPFLGQRFALLVRESPTTTTAVRTLIGALEVTLAIGSEADRRSAVVAALEGWYRAQAGADFRMRVSRFAPLVDVAPAPVLVGAQKHLWGSCSPNGVLRLNWRLIMAPPNIVDYVVVHELCHLRHPHHQKPFWDAVGAILPDYRARRAELRRDGEGYRL